MANPKAVSTLYFSSGKTLDVLETVAQITALVPPAVPMGTYRLSPSVVTVTAPAGDQHWVQMRHVERISPA